MQLQDTRLGTQAGQSARLPGEEAQAQSSSRPWLSAGDTVNRRRGDPTQALFGEVLLL